MRVQDAVENVDRMQCTAVPEGQRGGASPQRGTDDLEDEPDVAFPYIPFGSLVYAGEKSGLTPFS